MDLIEKKGETVSFSCIKFYAQNMPECRILHLIFKKKKVGDLFKFKSDLFNKNEVKTLIKDDRPISVRDSLVFLELARFISPDAGNVVGKYS